MLRDRPGAFAAGEMLDWEAPTGGYLLTACLATGRQGRAGGGAVARTCGPACLTQGQCCRNAKGPRALCFPIAPRSS
jgi:hypothetical protein